MTDSDIQVHVPVLADEPAAPVRPAARRPLAGPLVVGLVDNGKPRARDLLRHLADALGESLSVDGVELISKPSAASPLSTDDAASLAARIDVAVTGLGDCGACSACSLQDALMLEELGVPATVLITDAFVTHVARFATVLGAPGYHTLTVPHPVATKDDERLRRLAAAVAPAAIDQLSPASVAVA